MSSTSTPRRASPSRSAPGASSPLLTAGLLASALGYGFWLLVDRGRLSWPPHELLAGVHTLAGCLALVGPIVLSRRDGASGGLGDLAWMSGGLLVWVNNLALLAQGGARDHSWVAPVEIAPMGLTILAVMLAGWRLQGGTSARQWSWTNVVGWMLGLFWIGLALSTLLPEGTLSTIPR